MLDDDTRFITGLGGCFCDLHLQAFRKRTGKEWSREELILAVDQNQEIARQYDKLLKESIVDHAANIRKAIDSIDPAIPCFFCCCSQDVRHASAMAETLAAPGQEKIIRINNGCYGWDSPRRFAEWLHFTAQEIAAFPDNFTLLTEPDTCPQNRYSTSCAVLNAQLTMSLILGCRGGKLWITRMSVPEFSSSDCYQKLLLDYAGFYRKLETLKIQWDAPAIPLPITSPFHLTRHTLKPHSWSRYFARLGLPFAFGKLPGGTVLLSGDDVRYLDDSELRKILSGKVLLSGCAALELTKRGFSEFLGCRAERWMLPTVSKEIISEKECIIGDGGAHVQLSQLAREARELSVLYHRNYDGENSSFTRLAPGTVEFRNQWGGHLIVLSCDVQKQLNKFDIMLLLCETRKHQLIGLLERLSSLPLYYPGDAELTVMTGHSGENRIVVLLNLGLDSLDKVPLKGSWLDNFSGMEQLMPDGSWQAVPADLAEKTLTLTTALPSLGTSVIRFRNPKR